MTNRMKVVLGVAIFGVVPFAVTFFLMDPSPLYRTGFANDCFLAVTTVALLAHGAGGAYAFIRVIRNYQNERRTRWLAGMLLGGSIAPMVWWVRVARQLPTAQ